MVKQQTSDGKVIYTLVIFSNLSIEVTYFMKLMYTYAGQSGKRWICLKKGKSFTKVANEVNVHPRIVSRWVRNMVQNESLEGKEDSSRPRILGQETWKSITSFVVLMLKRKDRVSCLTIQDHIKGNFCRSFCGHN